MKILLILSTLFLFEAALQAARQLLNYLPAAPVETKIVTDYTVADVMGIVFTELPANHPLSGKTAKATLKTEWPGATQATNIDQFLHYLFLTPYGKEEKVVMLNIHWILHEVMDVGDADKVAAITRVYNAQSDAAKKRKIAIFAAEVFPCLMDVNLLVLVRDLLDDDTVIKTYRPEGLPPRFLTVRGEARTLCLRFLIDKDILNYVFVPDDYPHLNKEDRAEAAYCSAMKNWMVSNWTTITAKTNEAKANQDRNYTKPHIKVFDPRIAQ